MPMAFSDALVSGAQPRVGGQLGVVAADQRQPERACEQRSGDSRRARRADVHRVEVALGERLHRRGEAWHADLQARVVGHVELAHSGEAPVDVGVGRHHLDLEARHPALADLLDRAGDAVHRADPVGDDRHARALAVRGGARTRELRLLVCQERRRGGVWDRGYAALEQAGRGGAHLAVLPGGAHGLLDGRAQLALVQAARAAVEVGVAEVVLLHVFDQAALVEVVELDRRQPRAQQAARIRWCDVGACGSLPGVALAQHPLHHCHHTPGVGGLRIAFAVPATERARRQRDRRVGPLRGTALFASGRHTSHAHVHQELLWGRGGRRLGPGASDVDAGVIVAAADAGAVERLDVHGSRAVELARASAVAGLPDLEQLGEPAAVAGRERRPHRVVGVGQRACDLQVVQVHRAQLHVAAVGLQPFVVLGRDSVAEDVHRLGLAAEVGGQLLGDEHVGALGDREAPRRSCRDR